MATRLLGATLNLLSAREVQNARDQELRDGGGLLLRWRARELGIPVHQRYRQAPGDGARGLCSAQCKDCRRESCPSRTSAPQEWDGGLIGDLFHLPPLEDTRLSLRR